jgi:hypothetical protein
MTTNVNISKELSFEVSTKLKVFFDTILNAKLISTIIDNVTDNGKIIDADKLIHVLSENLREKEERCTFLLDGEEVSFGCLYLKDPTKDIWD